ncbi:MAG: TatD family hydrolase [Actinomycetota bacterium]
MSGWTDAHCHLQERYDRSDEPSASFARDSLLGARQAGVETVVCVGTDLETSQQALALAQAANSGELGPGLPRVAAVVGLHPHEAEADLSPLAQLMAEDRELISAVGECGLDYHYDHADRAVQRQAFAAQVGLAHAHDLALVIHVREAFDDLFAILESEGVPRRSLIHCFTAGPEEASRALALGMDLSFSGVVTFKNATELREAVALCPDGRFTVETDAPFLAPVPHRGKPNLPEFVVVVGEAVAEIRGTAPEDLAAMTSATAERIFGLPPLL